MTRVSRMFAGLSVSMASVVVAPVVSAEFRTSTHGLHAVAPPQVIFTRQAQSYSNWNGPARSPQSMSEIEIARKDLSSVSNTLRRQFLTSSEYTGALQATRDAGTDYRNACRDVLTQLR